MPRVARIKSDSGIYHIIMRGINRQTIFEDVEDCTKFIQTLHKYKDLCEYKIYAYCLMGNHIHLLIKEGKEPLENIMRRICGSYVFWYNSKYGRVGYLFQDRYKSEPVENERYFLAVLRYIFLNPIKAGIVSQILSYQWTNYLDYIEGVNQPEIDFVLKIFHMDRENAIKKFMEYMTKMNDDKCLDILEKQKLTDDEARKLVQAHYKVDHATDIQKFDKVNRNLYLKDLKQRHGLSIRQIERITGISRGVIQRM